MIDRRELLKLSLLGCGAALTNGALGPLFSRVVFAEDTASAGPIVKTSFGRVRGAFANGIYSFRGIHYGASTEGPMRFLPPSPARAWTGVRDALEDGPPAPQDMAEGVIPPDFAKIAELLTAPGKSSEDCLVLNVWTPSLRGPSKRPVMVWLHGGGFTTGSSGISMYDGTNLATKHDVVVVGVNHRLNVLGYLYLGKLGGEKYADSGNVGMLDIVLALKWVRDNISQFGGDPGNVTIFGESGGGGKVSTLMAMPPAKGLFHKAIVQSGFYVLRAISPEDADAAARKFLANIHVAPDHVEDLQRIPIDQLIAGLHSMTGSEAINLSPVVDGRSLPRHPFDPDAPAAMANVPMMIGTTSTETTTLVPAYLGGSGWFSLSEADMKAKLKADFQLTDDSKLDELLGVYKKNRPNATPSDIFFAVTSDSWVRMNAITQAERKVAQGAASVFMYIFEWQTPVLGGKLRSPHVVDVPFVFDNIDKACDLVGTGANLQRLADKASSAWVAFARFGNPSHAGLPRWPAYDTQNRATMIFNDECRVVNDPGKDERLVIKSVQ